MQHAPRSQKPKSSTSQNLQSPTTNPKVKQQLQGMNYAQQQQQLVPPGQGPQKGKGPTAPKTTGPNQGGLQKAVKNLGEVASVQGAFMAIGGIIDTFAPTAGQGFSGSLDVKIKPPLGSGFYMNLNFEGTAKRNSDDKLELEGKVALVVGAAGKVSYFDGYVGARGMLALKATADSGFQALELLGIGIHRTVAAWTTKGADWLFGKGYEEGVVGKMTAQDKGSKADSLEFTGELGAEGGMGAMDESGGAEGKLAAGYRNKTVLSKEKSGDKKAKVETEHGFMVALGAKAKALGLEFEGGVDAFLTKGKDPQWELKGELAADSEKLKDHAYVAKAVGDVIGGLVGVVRSGISTYQKGKDGQKEPAIWNGLRTAVGALSMAPKATMAKAMVSQGKGAPKGSKPAFELGLKFEGKELKEFGLESVAKYEPGEEIKKSLEFAGVELGGKTTTNLWSQKN